MIGFALSWAAIGLYIAVMLWPNFTRLHSGADRFRMGVAFVAGCLVFWPIAFRGRR